MKYKYILVGEGHMAMPIHSDMLFFDLQKHINNQVVTKNGKFVFRWGVTNFINPKLMMLNDFADNMPGLI